MGVPIKSFFKITMAGFVIAAVVSFAFLFDNLMGYFKFVSLCKNEGGLVVIEKLEKDVGWRADNYFDGLFLAFIEGVGFVRFPNSRDDNREYDLYYTGGERLRQDSYKREKFIFDSAPLYEVIGKSNPVDGFSRIEKVSFEFLTIDSRSVSAVYHDFEYDFSSEDDLFYWGLPIMSCSGGMSEFYEDLNDMFE